MCAEANNIHPIEKYADLGVALEILEQNCKGEALAIVRGIGDSRGVRAWSRPTRKYSPKTIVGRVRLVEQIVRSS